MPHPTCPWHDLHAGALCALHRGSATPPSWNLPAAPERQGWDESLLLVAASGSLRSIPAWLWPTRPPPPLPLTGGRARGLGLGVT